MKLKSSKFVVALLICAISTGCSTTKQLNNTNQIVSTKSITTIVTSFYPMYIATINVTKNIPNVKVINMTKPQTGCLHDYSVTPTDLKTLEKAQIFIINGAGMENFMSKVIKQQPQLKIVDTSQGIQLLKNKKDKEVNPHLWVSISDAILQVNNIAEKLAKYDPKNAASYRKNADIYISKLKAQKDKMHKSVDRLKNRKIITFHEAFPYFAKEFNLNIADIIEREPGSEPSARELKETIDIVKKDKVKALFAEPQYPAKAAHLISIETGAKMFTLDPAVSGKMEPDAYIKIMDSNLKSLQEALK